jgi:hypothetical protein
MMIGWLAGWNWLNNYISQQQHCCRQYEGHEWEASWPKEKEVLSSSCTVSLDLWWSFMCGLAVQTLRVV